MPPMLFLLMALAAIPTAFHAHAAGTGPTEQLVLILDWFVNPNHAPLIVAQQRGFFQQEGVAVTLVPPTDPNLPSKLVAAGKANLAIAYQPQLHLQVVEGLAIARIATLIDTPLSSLLVRADGPVRTLSDLKGRRIGYSISGYEDTLLRSMLGSGGISLHDVTLLNVHFALLQPLVSGQVDAVIGAFRNFEVNQMKLEGHPVRAFYPEESGVPPYDELIVVAHRDRLNDPRLPRFVAALERAVLTLLNDPERAWGDFITYQKDLDTELNRRAWADTLHRFAHNPGVLDPVRYTRFSDFLRTNGMISEMPPLSRYAVSLGGR
ncbi:putative thiamine biosynthesis protein HI_0357 [Azospirillaceae bacterium]